MSAIYFDRNTRSFDFMLTNLKLKKNQQNLFPIINDFDENLFY